jgi:hypothetical protein
MTTQNNDTGIRPPEGAEAVVDRRRRLVLIALAVALLVLAAGICFAVITLERGSRAPAALSEVIRGAAGAGPRSPFS